MGPGDGTVELPNQHPGEVAGASTALQETDSEIGAQSAGAEQSTVAKPKPESHQVSLEQPPRPETPSTQDQPSEGASTSPTTPISVQPHAGAAATSNPLAKLPSRTAVPAVPVLPALPKASPKEVKTPNGPESQAVAAAAPSSEESPSAERSNEEVEGEAVETPAGVAAKTVPKLWTGLFARSSAAAKAPGTGPSATNGMPHLGDANTLGGSGTGFAKSNSSSIAEAIQAYQVGGAEKLAFLEPRGLVNTGNMCYMNSVSRQDTGAMAGLARAPTERIANLPLGLASSHILHSFLPVVGPSEQEGGSQLQERDTSDRCHVCVSSDPKKAG